MPTPTFTKSRKRVEFSLIYREAVFNVWYQNECPTIPDLMTIIPPDDDGRKPDIVTVNAWSRNDGWQEHADALNAQLSVQTDQMAIEKRMEMFKKHAELGKLMSGKGEDYFKEHAPETATEAIRAITEGTKLERESLGLAEAYDKILNASNEELNSRLKKLLGGGEIIEGEVKDTDAGKSEADS